MYLLYTGCLKIFYARQLFISTYKYVNRGYGVIGIIIFYIFVFQIKIKCLIDLSLDVLNYGQYYKIKNKFAYHENAVRTWIVCSQATATYTILALGQGWQLVFLIPCCDEAGLGSIP